MIGMRPCECCTAMRISSLCSSKSTVGDSPVVPTTTMPAVPSATGPAARAREGPRAAVLEVGLHKAHAGNIRRLAVDRHDLQAAPGKEDGMASGPARDVEHGSALDETRPARYPR